MDIPIVVATIGAASALFAAGFSLFAQRSVRRLQEKFETHQRVTTFLSDQLSKLYLPVSMHLRATRALSATHYEADEATKTEIEHALSEHNKTIVQCLLEWSMYLDPDAPEEVSIDLLEHLLQWENVYKLKYDYGQHEGPIWDAIRQLGYKRFPEEAADHFHQKTKNIRLELHKRLGQGIDL